MSNSTGKNLQSSWKPILTGQLAEQALQDVRDISLDLNKYLDIQLNPSVYAEFALFYFYLDKIWPDENWKDLAREFSDRAFHSVAEVPMTPALYDGFIGVAWVIEHIKCRVMPEAVDPNSEIDEILLEYVGRPKWSGSYDLISGLIGIGVYALERLPNPRAAKILELIIDHLIISAQEKSSGLTWHTNPDFLILNVKEKYPNGYYNLGVAHGIPGVIGFLGQVCASKIAIPEARTLLNEAILWLLSQKLPKGTSSQFSYWVDDYSNAGSSRLAWCYGDPGIAITLLSAAKSVREINWEKEAVDLACQSANRLIEDSGVNDACICHGSAGLGHLYNRMYQSTGIELLGQAAKYWFQQTINMKKLGQGIAGYLTLDEMGDNEIKLVSEPGFLTGAIGIALALIAASTCFEPNWDRIILSSLR